MSLYEEMLLRQHEREKVERMAMEAEREATRIREEEEVCVDMTYYQSNLCHIPLLQSEKS